MTYKKKDQQIIADIVRLQYPRQIIVKILKRRNKKRNHIHHDYLHQIKKQKLVKQEQRYKNFEIGSENK